MEDISDSGIVTRLILDDLSLKSYNRITSSRSQLNQNDLMINNSKPEETVTHYSNPTK